MPYKNTSCAQGAAKPAGIGVARDLNARERAAKWQFCHSWKFIPNPG